MATGQWVILSNGPSNVFAKLNLNSSLNLNLNLNIDNCSNLNINSNLNQNSYTAALLVLDFVIKTFSYGQF